MKYVLAIIAFIFCGAAQAQDALVVQTCGTLPLAYSPGATRLLTVDTTGKLCGTGGGGAGNPGGSDTQVQYNNAGSFGGITGATTNGTALTLVAPVLGTPASGTLTNTTGFPIANLAGAGTGVLTALGVNVGSAGAFVTFNGALGTPSSGTLTNATGLPIAGITGLGTGVGTWLATPSSANLRGALTDETGTGVAVFGTSPTFSTGVTFGFVTGSTQCLHVDTSGVLSGTGSDCGSGGSVTSITPGAGLVSGVTASCTQTAITTTGTLSQARCINAQTGTTYAILDTDRGKLVTGSNAAAQAYSIAQAGAASAFANGWSTTILNKGVGTLTITPTTSTINGAATYLLFAGQRVTISSDGTNYQIDPGTTGGVTISSQTGANYAFVASDFGKLVNLSNGSNQVPTIAVASALGANWFVQACNQGAGTQTITPTTSTIGGAATFVLPAASAARPACVGIVSDGTNYQVVPDFPMDASMFSAGTMAVARGGTGITSFGTGVATAMGSNVNTNGGLLTAATAAIASNAIVTGAGSGTALTGTTPGTGVLTALGVNLSAAGGITSTIASGTSALGTSAIGSAACATAVTTAATNAATTDAILWGFNGDPTAVTGYVPLVAGMLTIIAYPSSGNVNFKVCNNTSGSITPGAITLNWRVIR